MKFWLVVLMDVLKEAIVLIVDEIFMVHHNTWRLIDMADSSLKRY
jgi:hypothetical protein